MADKTMPHWRKEMFHMEHVPKPEVGEIRYRCSECGTVADKPYSKCPKCKAVMYWVKQLAR